MTNKEARLTELEAKSPVLTGVDEIAAHLRSDVKTVERLIGSGQLKVKKLGKTYKTTTHEIERQISATE